MLNIEDRDGTWTKGQPWWYSWSIGKSTFLGKTSTETFEGPRFPASVPMPEGNYFATWTEKRYVKRYTGRLGRLRDRVAGPRQHSLVDLDIPGGIPHEGKGENSWDCGMDGLFGCSGATVAEAIANAVRHTQRDRERYGGPHNLTRPMTVAEAGATTT